MMSYTFTSYLSSNLSGCLSGIYILTYVSIYPSTCQSLSPRWNLGAPESIWSNESSRAGVNESARLNKNNGIITLIIEIIINDNINNNNNNNNNDNNNINTGQQHFSGKRYFN